MVLLSTGMLVNAGDNDCKEEKQIFAFTFGLL